MGSQNNLLLIPWARSHDRLALVMQALVPAQSGIGPASFRVVRNRKKRFPTCWNDRQVAFLINFSVTLPATSHIRGNFFFV
jgi:hypothetical protein